MAQSLPVLMYHYISNYPNSISVSPKHFEEHCRGMAESGWRGISLQEAEFFFLKGEPLPPKSVLITFDDGYLDNFVYAWPLLQKYGHKGVIFAVTERLSSNQEVHPTLFDVWNNNISLNTITNLVDNPIKITRLGLKKRKDLFLSWNECRIMEKSGTLCIGAHSAHHLATFSSNTWDGLYVPTDQHRTFYKINTPIVWGMPCFKEKSALQKAFIPSTDLIQYITKNIPQDTQKAYEYFQQQDNIQKFEKELRKVPANMLGAFETTQEYTKRLQSEFEICKYTLEQELGHTVMSFCWPWGEHSQLAESIGQEYGFSIFYRTSMGPNVSKNALAINRFKVRDKGWNWLRLRLEIYSRPIFASCYAKIRL